MTRRLSGPMAALALLAAGCMIGPDFQRPPAKIAPNWSATNDAGLDINRVEYRDWWAVFNDPVLTRLVAIAYRQNLGLLAAGVRVLEARAQLGIAIGNLYPQQQQAGASINYNRIPISVPYNLVNNTFWEASFEAQSSWEIDLWGKLRRGIQSADDAYLASVADYDDVLVTLTGDVASTYVQIRTLQQQIEIARENVVRQRAALQIAEIRFKGGASTQLDPDQATYVLGATEAAIPELKIQLAQSRDALSVLLGMPPGGLDPLLEGSSGIPNAPGRAAVGIPADLMRRRPDIRRAELEAAAQCAQIGFAKADLLPTFSLLGTVGTVSTNVGKGGLGSVFTAGTLAYSAGPGLQWNIFNYGQITNNVRYQDARFQELIVDYQNAVLSAQQEVENGIAQFLDSRREVQALKLSVAGALGAVQIATIQYTEGTRDFTAVLTAEQDLYSAQNNLAIASGGVPLGLIAIYRALGGGWQIREGSDFVPAATRDEMSNRTNWGTLLSPELLQPRAPGLPGPRDTGPLIRAPEF
ncbi:MAG TPA: efflux transporter outer membrane subunit [Candidatus Binataceae bacterium]|nr:efflux transporter outer membrane subunit [Candidatus Binataceae bacterium]